MGQDPEAIRSEIAATRERMGDAVDALAYKADVKSRAKDSVNEKVDNLKSKVTGARDSVTGAAGSVSDAAPGTEDVKHVARRGKGLAQENPLGLAIGSVAVGFLAGLLIPTTRVEDEKLGPDGRHAQGAGQGDRAGRGRARQGGRAGRRPSRGAGRQGRRPAHAEDAKSDLRDQAQQGRDQVASSAPTSS